MLSCLLVNCPQCNVKIIFNVTVQVIVIYMKKTKQKIVAFVLLIFAAALIFLLSLVLERQGFELESFPIMEYHEDVIGLVEPIWRPVIKDIDFSHKEHFYTESIGITFSINNENIIQLFYTLDGSPPHGASGIVYTEPIMLTADLPNDLYQKQKETNDDYSDWVNSYVLKVCGQKSDGTFTAVYTHTYFVGGNVNERFDTLVFSLSTDPYNLYDYEYGILNPGKLRSDFMIERGITGPYDFHFSNPANFNIRGNESERPVYVELIDGNGNSLLAQNAAMRVFGTSSRIMSQKSLKLIAGWEFDENFNRFNYDFFPDDRTYYGRTITSYKRIVLRNNSNDSTYAFLRDATVMDLSGPVLQDTQSTRAAAVYLNGEYYGFVWVTQVYDNNYFDTHNEIGEREGEWITLKDGGEREFNVDVDNQLEVQALADYQFMYDLSVPDYFFDEDIFSALCELIDIDNFLTYYAVQIYIDNDDWSYKNYKPYRYYGDDSYKYQDGMSTADGKWRWLIYDTDQTLGLYRCVSTPSLGILLGFEDGNANNGVSPLLAAVVYTAPGMRERFATILCDLMNWHFSPTNVTAAVRKKEAERNNELLYNFKYGGFQLTPDADFIQPIVEFSPERTERQIDWIINWANERPGEMIKQIEDYLFIDPNGYIVACSPHEIADIKLNTFYVTNVFEGFYFDICTVTFTASNPDGYIFSHWLVNGVVVTDEELIVGKDDAKDGRVNVELVLKPDEQIVPVITRIDYKGRNDYIVIHNPYTENIDLRNFYISDDLNNPFKQVIANKILRPGQSIKLYARNYIIPDALGGFGLSFNLRRGETLTITNIDGEMVFSMELPQINHDYVLVRNKRTGQYKDVLREIY